GGATLVLSGRTQPLLDAYGAWSGGRPVAEVQARPDIVFEDFEGDYSKWTVEGTAFGDAPTRRALRDQPPAQGFIGQAFANSFHGSDSAQGRLISREFTVERNFIRFRVGGGNSSHLQVRLIVDGKTVRATTSAAEDGRLRPASWDVREFAGRAARIEIVDQKRGDFGHITVDQIEFTDLPCDRAVMELLEALLPGRFQAAAPIKDAQGPNTIQFEGLALGPDADEVMAADGRRLLTRRVGRGQVIVVCGPVLEPSQAGNIAARQRAYAFLCGLVGARYAAPEGVLRTAPGFGTLTLTALHQDVTVATSFEDWSEVWRRFCERGTFGPLAQAAANAPTPAGRTINGAVAASVRVPAGETVEVPFLLTWHYPNKYNDTRNHPEGIWIGCHYATLWPDAAAVAREAAEKFEELKERTRAFRRAIYDSTLPWWLLDALTSNAAIIRHIGVVFRIANGDVYGWEGSNGCCPPTCTHVWGYAQTMARLFPELERGMRRIDFKHQQRADGGVNNRTAVPSPPHPTGERPFADGHASTILKAYREALNSPDEAYFREYWPHVRRAVEYLIARDAESHGGEPAGYLEDAQWNTYDQALHGVTTFLSGYYLAALRAGEEWARRVGEPDAAQRFRTVFERGRAKLVELCWNGEYFQQHLPDDQRRPGEVGPGCMSDQLLGQWWAHQLGLGYVLPPEKVRAALGAIFHYNWKPDLTGWPHSPRAFAGAGDKGLIICTWPRGGRPKHVMLYSDEVWSGIEYQVAAHMIYEGMIEEGLMIAKGARDRYDGVPRPPIPRNPWSEIECGGHYVRAMASWSLLTALSGYEYDGPAGRLAFAPRLRPERFKAFFTGAEGWGTIAQEVQANRHRITLDLVAGGLTLQTLEVAPVTSLMPQKLSVRVAGHPVPARLEIRERLRMQWDAALRLSAG
ncbi:MAG: GH116 family glycosyl hydrolase, partial [Verrucomicrobiales bacterium]|nr:GH116 family glycosyl hydrolase [Verrucomicrobiales bacterium]